MITLVFSAIFYIFGKVLGLLGGTFPQSSGVGFPGSPLLGELP